MARYIAVTLLIALSACHAPVTYLRPGVSQVQFDTDYTSCIRLARIMHQAPMQPDEYYRVRGIIGEEVFIATVSKQRNWPAELWNAHMSDARRNAIVDSCMVAQGYRIESAW